MCFADLVWSNCNCCDSLSSCLPLPSSLSLCICDMCVCSISKISPSWSEAGRKKKLCLLHYRRKIKCIHSFIHLFILSLSLSVCLSVCLSLCLSLHCGDIWLVVNTQELINQFFLHLPPPSASSSSSSSSSSNHIWRDHRLSEEVKRDYSLTFALSLRSEKLQKDDRYPLREPVSHWTKMGVAVDENCPGRKHRDQNDGSNIGLAFLC